MQIQITQMRHQNKTNIEILYRNVGLELSERDKEKFENSKRVIWSRNSKKKLDNAMIKRKGEQRQIMGGIES